MKQKGPDRIESILNSLDGLEAASPRPFFYTRLLASMKSEARDPWSRVLIALSKPSVAFAVSVFFIIINMYVVFYPSDTHTETPEELVSSTAMQDYDIHYISFYETPSIEAP